MITSQFNMTPMKITVKHSKYDGISMAVFWFNFYNIAFSLPDLQGLWYGTFSL